ncbi:hypothetical protein EV361DRAFT_807166, partial [Lentinula raphanica]
MPSICACCGSEDTAGSGCFIEEQDWPSFTKLKVTDPFILQHVSRSRLTYLSPTLDGLLLDKKGIVGTDENCTSFKMYLCGPCKTALGKDCMPRLALNNHLYRGDLPSEFEDLTWAEEMACALYHTTAHISRLYGSASEENPLQLHGNICAHPLDICSHATTLPWAPADVNNLVSIVFVGTHKLTTADLKKLSPLYVRRNVIRRFLSFLCMDNRLYIGLPPPDENILALYPEHDVLPDLDQRIIY